MADISQIKDSKTNTLYNVKDAQARADLLTKQDALTFDSFPTSGSNNLVKSGGIHSALATKADKETTYTKIEVNNLIVPVNTEIVVVTSLPASGSANTIYRMQGTDSYTDYGWDGTQFVPLATYNGTNLYDSTGSNTDGAMTQHATTMAINGLKENADEAPSVDSENLVKSRGIMKIIGDTKNVVSYPANCGLIWDGSKVASANQNYDGVLKYLYAGVTYKVKTNATSCIAFNSRPQINDVGTVIEVDVEYTPSVNQYLLVTCRLSSLTQVDIETSSFGLKKELEDINENITDLNNDFDAINDNVDAINNRVDGLDEEINGEETTEEIPCTLTGDKYFNTKDYFTSGNEKYYKTNPSALSGCYCLKIEPCYAGETYKIHSQNNGTGTIGLYIYTDEEHNVISAVQSAEDVTVNITVDGSLYVNLRNYNPETDYVKKVVTIKTGGYKEYVNQQLATLKGLYGKTLVCFGDSITELKDAANKSYPDYISEIYGANMINCGIGGTRLMRRTTPVLNPSNIDEGYAGVDIITMVMAACGVMYDENTPYTTIVENAANYLKTSESDDNTAIVQRLLEVNWSEVDGVVVFAGTNDWNNGAGHWGESGSNDVGTTMGAINEIIRLLLTTYKHLKLYWFTPIVRWIGYSGGTGTDDKWSDVFEKQNTTLKEFSKEIQDEVELNHIPVCDLYNTLGVNKYNFSQYFPDDDGTHPRKGLKLLAGKIGAFIVANKTV